ncbi:MAG: hypothetical protein R3F56_23555 [Planctomycetota bacterium]
MLPRLPLALALATLVLGAQAGAQNQSRSGSYFRSIGNSWLGGSLSAAAGMSTSSSTRNASATVRTANTSFNAAVDASVLTVGLRAAQLDVTSNNTVTTGSTGALGGGSASLRLRLAGQTVWDRSVNTTGSLGGIPTTTYNALPTDARITISVGPFAVRLAGNGGVTMGAGATVGLSPTTPEVRLMMSFTTAFVARAHVALGVAGFYAGVELQGRFAEQRLTHSTVANASTGLSGVCSLEVQAMSLRLIAYLEALGFRAYSTTLTSWGSGWLTRDLLNL